MRAVWQLFPILLFIVLHKVVLTFESVYEKSELPLWYFFVMSKVVLTFESVDEIL